MINSPFMSRYQVYIEDTDCLGMVYHSNYLCFLERARSDMFKKVGLPVSMLLNYNCKLAIKNINLDYCYPARLDDTLVIATLLKSIKRCSLVFSQVINNQTNRLVCRAEISVVCLDAEFKPRRLPESLSTRCN